MKKITKINDDDNVNSDNDNVTGDNEDNDGNDRAKRWLRWRLKGLK